MNGFESGSRMPSPWRSGWAVLAAGAGLAVAFGALALVVRVDPPGAGAAPAEAPSEGFRAPAGGWAEEAEIPTGMREPRGIAIAPGGRLAVTGDESVARFGADGKREPGFGLPSPAFCVAVAPDGEILLGTRDHVEAWGEDGARRAEWAGMGEEARLTSVAAGPDQVLAADAGNRLVWRFDRSGVLLGLVGEDPRPDGSKGFVVPSPCFDAAIGPDGSAWIADPGRQRLERYSPEGAWESSWGRPSMEIDGFCG
ncbi:MAG: hypothetical protein MUC63_09175 [Planctomycetes bacterium]|nr:hypothetical protein [Planctomycetota bacterium]